MAKSEREPVGYVVANCLRPTEIPPQVSGPAACDGAAEERMSGASVPRENARKPKPPGVLRGSGGAIRGRALLAKRCAAKGGFANPRPPGYENGHEVGVFSLVVGTLLT
jgi:hypothetical protein